MSGLEIKPRSRAYVMTHDNSWPTAKSEVQRKNLFSKEKCLLHVNWSRKDTRAGTGSDDLRPRRAEYITIEITIEC